MPPRPAGSANQIVTCQRVLRRITFFEWYAFILRYKPTNDDKFKAIERNRLVRLRGNREAAHALVDQITAELASFTELFLGDSYENPNREELDDLIVALLYQFGYAGTALYIASVIEIGAPAAELLTEYFKPGGILYRDPNQPEGDPVEAVNVDPPPTRTGRARRPKQQPPKNQSQRNTFKKKKSSPAAPAPGPAPEETPVEFAQGFEHEHGAVRRSSHFVHPGDQAGHIHWVEIPFADGDGEKVRPVIVIGISTDREDTLVLPVYSNAHKPAGGWRATTLRHYTEAGLDHHSYVSPAETLLKGRFTTPPAGRVHVSDWERICFGEMQATDS